MRILISNDDGYRARGIHALREGLKGLGDLTVVAPDRNRSGASNSLTLELPLRVGQAEADVYFVEGTPTDCVHLAVSGLFPFEPDMVVSGVNDGSNLGDDVLYSGTVAAATEGRFLGKAAVAVSLHTDGLRGDATRHFETGAHFARVIVERLSATPLTLGGRATILNVNVPNLPVSEVKRHQGHATRQPPSLRSGDQGRGSARTSGVLGGARGRQPGRGTRHGFSRSRRRLCVRHAAHGRSHQPRGARWIAQLVRARRVNESRTAGIGMTSARTRDRLVQRLREQGIANAAVLDRIRNVPRHIFVDEALASRALTKTPRCRSVFARPFRSLTSSRA